MNPMVEKIANALLYEGYLLYPYRRSAVKNRQRFNFGVVYPRAYIEAMGRNDLCTMQTECLILATEETQCRVRVRFLRLVDRTIGKFSAPSADNLSLLKETAENVERLDVNGQSYQAWQEAAEETIDLPEFTPNSVVSQPMVWPILLSARREKEPIRDENGMVVGIIRRDRASISGSIEVSGQQMKPGLFKVSVRIANECLVDFGHALTREEALPRSLVSAHTILEVRAGEFVSLLDPPDGYGDFAKACRNLGTWPVLVGEPGQHDTLLSSPIILYDYPEVAPESPGDLFDGAEIDEILSLRILTMTEEEKSEVRGSDERARKILERTETLTPEQLMKLHGALRGLRSIKGAGGQA